MTSPTLWQGLTYADFKFTDQWVEDLEGPKDVGGIPVYIIDKTTGRRYWNVSPERLAFDGCWTSTFNLIPNFGSTVLYSVARIFKLVSFYHCWPCIHKSKEIIVFSPTPFDLKKSLTPIPEIEIPTTPHGLELFEVYLDQATPKWPLEPRIKIVPLNWGDRFSNAGLDVLKLLAAPINCLAMEYFACYTVWNPTNNGRKLYMTFEAIQYDGYHGSYFSRSSDGRMMPEEDRRLPPAQMLML